MPSTQKYCQEKANMDPHRDAVCGPAMLNWSTWNIDSVGDSMIGYGKSRTRVSVRGVRRPNAHACFCIFTEVLSVNGPMLISTRPHGAPTTNNSMFGFKGKDELGVRVCDIRPVDNNGSEWIFNSNTNVRKENYWSMQEAINHGNQEKHESDRSDLPTRVAVSLDQDRSDQSRTKNIPNSAVKVSSTGSKEFGITAGLSQFFEGGSRHE
jgi:hypothetical protein